MSQRSKLLDPQTAHLSVLFKSLFNRASEDMLLEFAARLTADGMPAAPPDAGGPSMTGRAAPLELAEASPVAARRVLLVDDDEDALRILALTLRRSGYDVVPVMRGDDALTLLTSDGTTIDALVTDYAMPGLNGLSLIELALERQPDLPALLMTGYARDAELERLPAHVPILAKPYTRADLLRRLVMLMHPGARGWRTDLPAGPAPSHPVRE